VQEDPRYLREILQEFDDLPRFADGRINFSSSNKAPVVTCFVEFDGRMKKAALPWLKTSALSAWRTLIAERFGALLLRKIMMAKLLFAVVLTD